MNSSSLPRAICSLVILVVGIISTCGAVSFDKAPAVDIVPLPTGTSGNFLFNPLYSMVSKTGIYLLQHFENDVNITNVYEETIVLQGFDTETTNLLYSKRFTCIVNMDSTFVPRDSQQRVFEINATHAIVLCSKPTALSAFLFNVATGAVEWTVAVHNTTVNPMLRVNSIDMQHKLVSLTDNSKKQWSYILDVQRRALENFTSNGIPQAFVNATSSYISVETDRLASVHYPTLQQKWSIRATIAATLPKIMTVHGRLVIPIVTRGDYEVRFIDVTNGDVVATIPTANRFPFIKAAALTPTLKLEEELHGGKLLLRVQVVATPSSVIKITCGVIAFDITGKTPEIAWSSGFEVLNEISYGTPHPGWLPNYGRGETFKCQWYTSSSSPFGWLVRPSTSNFLAPNVTVVNTNTGHVVATAGDGDGYDLALPAAMNFAENRTAFHQHLNLASVPSALFDDTLLLQYTMKHNHGTLNYVGIRLQQQEERDDGSSSSIKFARNFEIWIAKTTDYVMGLAFSFPPWVAQRVGKDILIVPTFSGVPMNRGKPSSALVWANITLTDPSPSHSHALVIVLGIVGCLGVVLIIAACLVGGKLRHSQKALDDYETLN